MRDEGTAVCTGCGRPVRRGQYYCEHCGTAVSNLTPYIPYVNIPFNYGPFNNIWKGAKESGVTGWRRVLLYVLMGVLFAPLFVIAVPFIIAEWVRTRKGAGSRQGDSKGR